MGIKDFKDLLDNGLEHFNQESFNAHPHVGEQGLISVQLADIAVVALTAAKYLEAHQPGYHSPLIESAEKSLKLILQDIRPGAASEKNSSTISSHLKPSKPPIEDYKDYLDTLLPKRHLGRGR